MRYEKLSERRESERNREGRSQTGKEWHIKETSLGNFAAFGDAEKKFFKTFNEFMASKSLKTLYSLSLRKKRGYFYIFSRVGKF